MVDSPTKLTPGIANKIELEIENDGNGATQALIDLPTLPDTWQWWIRVDDQNHSGAIDLSASYDLEDIKTVEIWILISMTESAGILHSIEITVSSLSGLSDIQPDDNRLEINAITASHKQPQITNVSGQIGAMAGSSASVNISIQNIGNAVDNQISVRATISSSPPTPGLVGFFSVGSNGGALAMSEWSDIALNGGEETTLNVDVIVPKDTPLNTRIIIKFEIVGGLDEEQRPYQLQHEAMIMVDSRRSMTSTSSPISNQTNPFGVAVPLWINVTSTSTVNENYIITSKVPQGWQVVCLGVLMNESGYPINTEVGHIEAQEKFVSCDVHRLSGQLNGQIEITVTSQDGTLTWQDKQSIYFQEQIDSSFSLETDLMVASGLAFFVFIALVAVLIRKRSPAVDEQQEIIEEGANSEQHVVAGPPITQASIAVVQAQVPVQPLPVSQDASAPKALPTIQPLAPIAAVEAAPAQIQAQSPATNLTDQPATAPTGPPQSEAFTTQVEANVEAQGADVQPSVIGPPLPESGLPDGWTMEQWQHYGQQHLDGTL